MVEGLLEKLVSLRKRRVVMGHLYIEKKQGVRKMELEIRDGSRFSYVRTRSSREKVKEA